MSFSITSRPFGWPDKDEIASLAFKFYVDRNREEGHDLENWLCAEYMLTQKHLIQRQIDVLHNRATGTKAELSK
jgi:hypothetical protein